VPAGSQLADYQMRGAELSNVCVWDFISRVDKIKKTYDRRNLKPKSDDFDEQEDDLIDENESHEMQLKKLMNQNVQSWRTTASGVELIFGLDMSKQRHIFCESAHLKIFLSRSR
jgi:hypothetical protein